MRDCRFGTGGSDAYGGSSDFQGDLGPQHASLVHAFDAHNITIEGGGEIHGGGDFWWEAWEKKLLHNVSRPHTVHLVRVKDLIIRDISVRRSPSWTVHLTFCDAVVVDRLFVQTNDSKADGGNSTYPPANADGLDLDSCSNVVVRAIPHPPLPLCLPSPPSSPPLSSLFQSPQSPPSRSVSLPPPHLIPSKVRDSVFYTHDDSIAFKSGKDWFGRAVGAPTENVTVTGCTVQSNDGGIVVGSEMSGGIRDVLVQDLTCLGGAFCLWIKSARNRGGSVERLRFSNITSLSSRQATIAFDMYYTGDTVPVGNRSSTPTVRDVSVHNLTGVGVAGGPEAALWFRGLPESPMTNISLTDITLTTISGPRVAPAKCAAAAVRARDVLVDGIPWQGCNTTAG